MRDLLRVVPLGCDPGLPYTEQCFFFFVSLLDIEQLKFEVFVILKQFLHVLHP